MSRPFINVTDDAGNKHRIMVSKIVRWGVPQSKDRSESAKSYLRLVGDNPDVVRLSNESPAEIDALIEAALADQQPTDREPQAASPRTDETQDPVARLEAWRGYGLGRHCLISHPSDSNPKYDVVLYLKTGKTIDSHSTDLNEAVTFALAVAKEAGHG